MSLTFSQGCHKFIQFHPHGQLELLIEIIVLQLEWLYPSRCTRWCFWFESSSWCCRNTLPCHQHTSCGDDVRVCPRRFIQSENCCKILMALPAAIELLFVVANTILQIVCDFVSLERWFQLHRILPACRRRLWIKYAQKDVLFLHK